MKKVAVITGGSGGIGLETARFFSKNGYKVYELSRSGSSFDGVAHLTADVADKSSVTLAIQKIVDAEGKIDVLVANAGMGISGAVECTEDGDIRKIFEVNVFGAVNAITAVIPNMRKNRGGKIICISSVASIVSIPFQAFYSMTKSSVNSLVLALRNELKPFNIAVCGIMPGDVKTGFTKARKKSPINHPAYSGRIERSVTQMEHDEQNGMPAERIAKKIYRLARKRSPKPLSTVGTSYKLICLLVKLFPIRMINSIVGKIYAK